MILKVSDKLKDLPKIDYRLLQDFQGNLKELSADNYEKFKTVLFGDKSRGIEARGFVYPFIVWFNSDRVPFIIDGHQRHKVLVSLDAQPYELPYIEIEAASAKEAKELLLLKNAQFGKYTKEGFDEFTFDIDPMFFELESPGFDWLLDLAEIESVDYTILQDDSGGLEQSLEEFEKNHMKAIQIEFRQEDYKPAIQLINKIRNSGIYVGGVFLKMLQQL